MKKYLLLLFLSFLWAASCKDNMMKEVEPVKNPYESCCGVSPVTFTIGTGKVYVPNVITANADGINDRFIPFYNSHVSKIENLSITDASGATLYTLPAFDLNDPHSGGWSGLITGSTYHKGLFNYRMNIFDNTGLSSLIQGSACSILCDSAAIIFKTKKGCFFPVQENGEGGVNPALPTYEEDCFKG